MAQLARQVLDAAVDAAGKADTLSERMEPHLQRLLSNSAIYSYTNERAVPPGDVLLAAALATGISLDDRLGVVRKQGDVERQMEELRAELAQLRGDVADLRGQPRPADGAQPAPEDDRAKEELSARRRRWARQAAAAPPAAQPDQSRRSGGRGAGM